MSTEISFLDANGARISGHFEVSDGVLTVTASDGRTMASEIEEDLLFSITSACGTSATGRHAPAPC
jgi:hypothetical protein